MDTTLAIALITAGAGIAGGLTTGAVSAMTAGRQDKRRYASEEAKWRRDLAEKDREHIHELFEQIIVQQKDLFERTQQLIRRPTPQSRDEQADSIASINELTLLCSRATILGAYGIYSNGLGELARNVRLELREGPLTEAATAEFKENYNQACQEMWATMSDNLKRLRAE